MSQLPKRHILEKLYSLITYGTQTTISVETRYPSHRVDYTLKGNKMHHSQWLRM
jgi:hypothetical protein